MNQIICDVKTYMIYKINLYKNIHNGNFSRKNKDVILLILFFKKVYFHINHKTFPSIVLICSTKLLSLFHLSYHEVCFYITY